MKKKKIIGATVPAILLIIYLLSILALFIYLGITEKNVPIPAFVIIIVGISIPIIGVSITLILRIKEIKKGELEESKKY